MIIRAIIFYILSLPFVFLSSCEPNQAADPLVAAAYKNDIGNVRAMLQNGYNVNSRNPNGDTALMTAAARGYEALVQLLLDHHANINQKNDANRTALMLAAMDGQD